MSIKAAEEKLLGDLKDAIVFKLKKLDALFGKFEKETGNKFRYGNDGETALNNINWIKEPFSVNGKNVDDDKSIRYQVKDYRSEYYIRVEKNDLIKCDTKKKIECKPLTELGKSSKKLLDNYVISINNKLDNLIPTIKKDLEKWQECEKTPLERKSYFKKWKSEGI